MELVARRSFGGHGSSVAAGVGARVPPSWGGSSPRPRPSPTGSPQPSPPSLGVLGGTRNSVSRWGGQPSQPWPGSGIVPGAGIGSGRSRAPGPTEDGTAGRPEDYPMPLDGAGEGQIFLRRSVAFRGVPGSRTRFERRRLERSGKPAPRSSPAARRGTEEKAPKARPAAGSTPLSWFPGAS